MPKIYLKLHTNDNCSHVEEHTVNYSKQQLAREKRTYPASEGHLLVRGKLSVVTFNLQVLTANDNSLASRAPGSVYIEPHGHPYAKLAWMAKENKLQRNCSTSGSIYLAVRSQYRLCLRLIKKINESIFPLPRSMGIQV